MNFWGLIKSKEEKVKEAVEKDIRFWQLMCTGIATTDAFFKEYPPKDMYMNLFVQKAWLFAAVITFLYDALSKDQKLFEFVADHIGRRIEEDDKVASEKVYPKLDVLMDVYGDITKNLKTQVEYVKSIMQRIDTPNVADAVAWMFCKSFLEMMTIPDEKINFDIGADFLYKQFMGFIASSKTIEVYYSCFKK